MQTRSSIPTFATVHLAIKYGIVRLKKNCRITDAELESKHTERKKLKKEILEITGKLRRKVKVTIALNK